MPPIQFTMKYRLIYSIFAMLFAVCISVASPLSGQTTGSDEFILEIDTFQGAIQWEQSPDRDTWELVSKGDVKLVSVSPSQTTYYRAKVTADGCAPIYSDTKAACFVGNSIVGAKLVKGQISLPPGSNRNPEDFSVLSTLEEVGIDSNGIFEVLMADSTQEDMLFITDEFGDVLMIGTFYGPNPKYVISPETSAVSLLMIYPWIEAVPTADKPALINRYLSDPDFANLLSQVISVITAGEDLFDERNVDLALAVLQLIGKDYNSSRFFRTKSLTSPVDINESGSDSYSVTFVNNTTFSYGGGVYQYDGNEEILVTDFLLAGSSLATSPWKPILTDRKASQQVTHTFGSSVQGEYLIKFRSGYDADNSPENDRARRANLRDLVISALDNIILNFVPYADVFGSLTDCMKSILTTTVDHSTTAVKNAVNNGEMSNTELASMVSSSLGDVVDIAENCATSYNPNKFLLAALKSVNLYQKVSDAIKTLHFAGEWLLEKTAIDGCKYVSNDGGTKVVNCFTMTSNKEHFGTSTNNGNEFPCEEVTLKVKLQAENLHGIIHTQVVLTL